MKKLTLFITFALIVGCKRPDSSLQNGESSLIEPDPKQYGIPYNNVPDSRDVILYQVNIRAFSRQGNFAGVRARLDSIKGLGINVVYLMPTYPVGVLKSTNSPYCIRDYKSVNTEFGTLDDLRLLVDEIHQKNMAVILDWVANHSSWDNGWIKNKSWYRQDSLGNIISPPYGWNDVAQLNFSNSNMRLAMIKAMKYWVLTANIDGYRCDFADGPPLDFWKQAIDTLRNISTHRLLLLAEGQRNANFTTGFDYNFGFKFFTNLKTVYSNNRTAHLIDSLNIAEYSGAADGRQIVRYLTNHDVNSSDGTPLDLFGGVNGSMAAFIVVAYMNSVPMIYNGQEVGTPFRLKFPFTSDKIDWTINPGITAQYKKVLAFRNSSPAIRRGKLTSYSSDDVCAFTKTQEKDEVFVISNLRNKSISYQLPPELIHTSWKHAFNGRSITLGKQIYLEPFAYLVIEREN